MFKNIFKLCEYQGKRTWFHKKYYVFDGCGIIYFSTRLEAYAWIRGRNSALEISFKKVADIYKRLNTHYVNNVFCRNSKYIDSIRYSFILLEVLGSFHYLTNQRYINNHQNRLKYIIDELIKLSCLFEYQTIERELLNIQKTVSYQYPRYESVNKPITSNVVKKSVTRSKLKLCV